MSRAGHTVGAEPLATARLTLEPLRVAHAEEMAAVLADPALHAFIGGAPDDLATLRARYARMVAGSPDPRVSWCNWVVRVTADGRPAGTVQATVGPDHASADTASGGPASGGLAAEIAWVVGTPWQGRGIASEAARALVAWLRGRPEVACVLAHIHPDHAASAAVARAAGLAPTEEWHDGEVKWLLTFDR
ncbi:GNAT family N-acetyltransferase [Streptomyces flavofungini]|uniref:GNAT family N-acetyltransferase n=1 Tax=Streptomyces flavofungini TaxID=68200 RepID=A0ABS0XFG1_9ACTN|nr:GNAT family N-acetyltransferase [Streptomyces flavofungini]MBJ3810329.1 GNAT family N-acetyltransferase [Streptomyces flavofungini]MBJ3811953.1 GNAT family N-acetyltransferase [Streptomyces flavofungini]GHC50975.1 acetyltransferase [Streptomyces flavofungini]